MRVEEQAERMDEKIEEKIEEKKIEVVSENHQDATFKKKNLM